MKNVTWKLPPVFHSDTVSPHNNAGILLLIWVATMQTNLLDTQIVQKFKIGSQIWFISHFSLKSLKWSLLKPAENLFHMFERCEKTKSSKWCSWLCWSPALCDITTGSGTTAASGVHCCQSNRERSTDFSIGSHTSSAPLEQLTHAWENWQRLRSGANKNKERLGLVVGAHRDWQQWWKRRGRSLGLKQIRGEGCGGGVISQNRTVIDIYVPPTSTSTVHHLDG